MKVQMLSLWLYLLSHDLTITSSPPHYSWDFFFSPAISYLFFLIRNTIPTTGEIISSQFLKNLLLQKKKKNLFDTVTFSSLFFRSLFPPPHTHTKILFDVCWYVSFKHVEIVGRRVTQTETRRFHVSSYQDVGNFLSYLELEWNVFRL